jgi:hypothetical protein
MFIRVLLGNNNFVNMPYSFVCVASILRGFRIYVAIPPRVLSIRLDSINE